MPDVNIVIRTFNEAKWLDLCIRALRMQSFADYSIMVVDSGSTDLTLGICQKYEVKVIGIGDYKPGKAINLGIAAVPNARYAVILSAHCIPTSSTWLEHFVSFMDREPKCVASYGLQSPMNFSHMDDARDLALTFTGKTRVTNDTFFHNANSIVKVDYWKNNQFDEDVKHIEDLIWAHGAVDQGCGIGFCREAEVTHYHGLHQHIGQSSFRADGLMRVLENNGLIKSWHLKNIIGDCSQLIIKAVEEPSYLNNIPGVKGFCWKEISGYSEKLSVQEVILSSLHEALKRFPDAIAVQFFRQSPETISWSGEIENIFFDSFPDAVVPAKEDHGNYWLEKDGTVSNVQDSYLKKENKSSIVKEALLEGGILSLSVARKSEMFIGSKIIHKVANV